MARINSAFSVADREKKASGSLASLSLQDLGIGQSKLSTKHPIPESAGDTITVVVIGEMVFKMVLLERLIERWKPGGGF